jgi:hypothetical protein
MRIGKSLKAMISTLVRRLAARQIGEKLNGAIVQRCRNLTRGNAAQGIELRVF